MNYIEKIKYKNKFFFLGGGGSRDVFYQILKKDSNSQCCSSLSKEGIITRLSPFVFFSSIRLVFENSFTC